MIPVKPRFYRSKTILVPMLVYGHDSIESIVIERDRLSKFVSAGVLSLGTAVAQGLILIENFTDAIVRLDDAMIEVAMQGVDFSGSVKGAEDETTIPGDH